MAAFNFKIHLFFAILVWILFIANDTFLNPVALLVAAVIPDCDIKTSPAGRIVPLWWIKWVQHRGITHTLWFMLVTALAVSVLFGYFVGVAWMIGYGTHLFLDATTPMSVRLFSFWGIRQRKRRFH